MTEIVLIDPGDLAGRVRSVPLATFCWDRIILRDHQAGAAAPVESSFLTQLVPL